MTPTELEAGLKLCEAATPGPWAVGERVLPISPIGNDEFPGGLPTTYEIVIVTERVHPQLRSQVVITPLCTSPYFVPERFVSIEPADAAFIAAARTLLPQALQELKELRKRLTKLSERLRRQAGVADWPTEASLMKSIAYDIDKILQPHTAAASAGKGEG